MTESELQKAVLDAALMFGFLRAHFRPAQTTRGWRTPVQADGAGFPDVVLVRERVIFVELKTARGKLLPRQEVWQEALVAAGAETYVWRPEDWLSGAIIEVLRSKKPLEVQA